MKLKFVIFLLFITSTIKAQFFNNVNNELCYFMYTGNDPIGPYVVYLVIDDVLDDADIEIIKKLNNSVQVRSWVSQRLSATGRRIEIERTSYGFNKSMLNIPGSHGMFSWYSPVFETLTVDWETKLKPFRVKCKPTFFDLSDPYYKLKH